MKSLIRLGLSLTFGLSLLACSSEKDPKEPKIPPTPEAKVAFTLNLEAEGALSELRVADKDLDFGVGAKGKINLKLKKDEEYTAHCFIQNEEGDKCFYGTIRFVATSERTLVVKRGPKSEIKFYDAMAKDSKHTDASDKYYGFDKDSKTKWYFTLNALIREYIGYLSISYRFHMLVILFYTIAMLLLTLFDYLNKTGAINLKDFLHI